MYFTVYKITNKINGKEYIGSHKTSDLNDGYMGSGVHLKRAQEKYGLENFSKEIIFRAVSSEVMYFIERMLVDEEYVAREDTYNLKLGGSGGFDHLIGKVVVKDIYSNIFSVSVSDERYLSGELKHICKDMVTVKDKDGNTFSVTKDDVRYMSGELTHNCKGVVSVKDKDGNCFKVNIDDERYLSGELVVVCKGVKHTPESNMRNSLKNKEYIWVKNMKIQKDMKIHISNLENYINFDWEVGRIFKKVVCSYCNKEISVNNFPQHMKKYHK